MNDKKKKSILADFEYVDKGIFIPLVIIFLAYICWGLFFGDSMASVLGSVLSFISGKLGALFLILTFSFFIFCIWLACSKYGKIKIGADDDKPEHSYFTWFSMLFAANYGVGITFWGASEPLYFTGFPAFGLEPNTAEAAELGLAYAYMHWGPIPWVFNLIAGIVLGYYIYRKNMAPRFSLGIYPLVGKERYGNWVCRLVDGVMVLAAMAAVTTAIGFAVNQYGVGLEKVLGIPQSTIVKLTCLIIAVVIFTWSCLSGVKKGIAWLSNMNIRLSIIVMFVVFCVGPTLFQLDIGTTAFGEFLNNFFKMSFWTDPINKSGFPQAWTMFYWAWWASCACQVGLFVASISKGRTIREMVVGLLIVAPLGTFVWFAAFGGGAIYQQFFGGHDLVSVVLNQGAEYGLFAFLETLPLHRILGAAYLLLCLIFLVTTGDSAVFSWSQVSMKPSYNKVEPAKSVRLIYCLLILTASAILIIRAGSSMSAIQSGAVSIAAPAMVIFVLYCFAIVKAVRADTPVTRAELDAEAAKVGRISKDEN